MTSQSIKYMVFDIESLPDERAFKVAHCPDDTVSPIEAVDRWRAEQKQAGESDFLPVSQQRPLSIGICLVGPDYRLHRVTEISNDQDDPQQITQDFWSGWSHYKCPTFVTYNGRTFDLPLMEYQAYRYRTESAVQWFAQQPGGGYAQNRHRYNQQAHFDVQEFLSNFGCGRISGGLNLFARMVGGVGKMGIDGSQVYRQYRDGNRGRIIAYGQTDAVDTYLMFLRTQFLTGKLSADQELQVRHDAQRLLAEHPNPVLRRYADLMEDTPRI